MQCSERVNNRALSLAHTPRRLPEETVLHWFIAWTKHIDAGSSDELDRGGGGQTDAAAPLCRRRQLGGPKLGHCARPARLGYQSAGGAANVSWCLLATSHVMISIGRLDLQDDRFRSVDL